MSIRARLALTAAVVIQTAGCVEEEPDPRVARGQLLYGKYCALCHGAQGEGYAADAATALFNQDFLAVADDQFLRESIARGRPGTPMSAWGVERGGPLPADDVDALRAFIRNHQRVPSIDVASTDVGAGEASRGLAAYEVYCKGCHGDEGKGGEYTSVANPEFLAVATDGYVRHVIERGRAGTPMPSFAAELSAQAIDDLVALIRSWQDPTDDAPCDPPSKDLGDPRLHAGGSAPGFPEQGRFVGVDDLKSAHDAGAEMVILDARPPCEYVKEHISGARSVPFYDAGSYIPQLPVDTWIVTYCACPHAEAGAAADALVAGGLTKVKVLDEGLPGWLARGYPVTAGKAP